MIDHESKQVKSKTARNVVVTQDGREGSGGHVDPGPLPGDRRADREPRRRLIVATAALDARSRRRNAAGEPPLGNVIADAQLEATAPTDFGGAVIAFMNPGGIRADLSSQIPAARRPASSRTASSSPSSRSGTR